MAGKQTDGTKDLKEIGKTPRRVFLDPSLPGAGSVVRVVLIAVLTIFLVSVVIFGIYQLSFLLFLIVLSIFLAYLLDPLVGFIRRPFVYRNREKLMPRPVAILLSYLLVFGVLVIAIAYLAPLVAAQIREFAENLPNYATLVQERIQALNNRYEQLMISEEVQTEINTRISAIVGEFGTQITALAGNTALEVVAYLPWLLLVPILAFFFLKDAALFRNMLLACFPSGRWRARAESFVTDVNNTLAGYTRAQLLSCLLIGTLCTLAFTLIGLDYALLLGILAGILEFIPLLGPLTIGIAATLVGGFSDNPAHAVWTAVFLIVLRIIHDYVTYPRIVRKGVHLHPLAVILSVLAGEQLAGIAGVFLSIPIVALITVLYKHILEHSGRTGMFAELFKTNRPDKKLPEPVE